MIPPTNTNNHQDNATIVDNPLVQSPSIVKFEQSDTTNDIPSDEIAIIQTTQDIYTTLQ